MQSLVRQKRVLGKRCKVGKQWFIDSHFTLSNYFRAYTLNEHEGLLLS